MRLEPGTLLGPYAILGLLGAGGMGEVYSASDVRLRRRVAIKILPSSLSSDSNLLRRFEQEARSASALSHPNILAIYDIGTHQESPYVVSELLEGETLRERMGGAAVPQRKAVDYALQIARGLAAAHEKGIVHRDLKPENLFLTKDGRVKILDFGLAKLTVPQFKSMSVSQAQTVSGLNLTESGTVVGTVGYMSPEQIRSAEVDHRSDIFSFGAVFYEMLTGRRAFRASSAVETMSAILTQDPPNLLEVSRNVSPALELIVRHCLEKDPEERFQSVRDLAFDLEMVSGLSGISVRSSGSLISAPARSKWRLWPVSLTAIFITVLIAGYFIARTIGEKPLPSYHQLTFRRGTIYDARFAPDGRTVLYSAGWGGDPINVFSTRTENPESRSLGQPNTGLLAVSSSGEMAILVNSRHIGHLVSRGTLARMPLVGGSPREVLENVQQADWSPDGTNLAVVRYVDGRTRLEYPAGNVLYESSGWVSYPRISPKGDMIAFLEHPGQWDNRGWVAVLDLVKNKKTLSGEWSGAVGLAWSPTGNEVWFTATKTGEAFALYAVTLSGRERLVARVPVNLMLHDISLDGGVLLTGYNQSTPVIGLPPGATKERDLSWLDYIGVGGLSDDGSTFIFSHWGAGSGTNYSAYLRKTDGSPSVRLGEGAAMSLSPDGKWVIALLNMPRQTVLLPTGAGGVRVLERSGFENHGNDKWHPDGKRVLFSGREPGHEARTYVQDIESGNIRPITPEGVTGTLMSPDGKFLIVSERGRTQLLYPIEEGKPRPISGLDDQDRVIRWAGDGRSLFVCRPRELPVKVYRLDVGTGRKELLKELMPLDPAGILSFPVPFLTPDGMSYLYFFQRYVSDLYLVEGLM